MTQPRTNLPADLSEADLQVQHEALRRGLRRVNIAWGVILAVLVMLAVGVVWKARQSELSARQATSEASRANTEAERAKEGRDLAHAATIRAEEQLWNAKLNEARFRRIAGGPGARITGEALIRELIQRVNLTEAQRLALRQEMIRQLATVDLALTTNWVQPPTNIRPAWDGNLTRYVWPGSAGKVEVHEYPSARLVLTLHGPTNTTAQACRFTPDGERLIARFHGGEVLVWDLESGRRVLQTRCVRSSTQDNPLFVARDSKWLGMIPSHGLKVQAITTNSAARTLQPARIVSRAAFSPDATRIAIIAAEKDTAIEIWRNDIGEAISRMDVGFPIWGWDWNPDGRRLVVSGDHGQLSIWDLSPDADWRSRSGELSNAASQATDGEAEIGVPREIQRFEGHTAVVPSARFTPDGGAIITRSWDSTSGLWEIVTGRRLFTETRAEFADISAGGDRILASKDSRQSVHSLLNRTGFRTLASARRSRPVHGVWLSPNGRLAAVTYGDTKMSGGPECQIWDVQGARKIASVVGIWAAFTPDSKSVLTFDFTGVRRFDVAADSLERHAGWEKGELLWPPEQRGKINTGMLSADGNTLVVASFDHVAIADLTRSNQVRRLNIPAHYATLSPDGSLLATRYHNDLSYVRNANNGVALRSFPMQANLFFSPDDRWLAVVQQSKLQLLERGTWRALWEIPVEVGASTPPAFAFSTDGSILAVAFNRNDVRLHQTTTGRELATLSPPVAGQILGAHALTFSEDDRWLVAAKDDSEVISWELPVIRSHLAKLGLDWESQIQTNASLSDTKAQGSDIRSSAVTNSLLSHGRGKGTRLATTHIGAFAFAAAGLAVLAGGFVFVVQRRMISSYGRVEALAQAQRQKLQTAQDELLHSQKMRALGTLAAGIAHDFNNLLSVIRLSNQLAAEQTNATGVAKENMSAIESAVVQGENIVNSMLGYSRAAGELPTEYSVADAVNESVAMLGRKFLAGIVLKLEIAADLPPAHGARGRLEQMLLNLIVNASEAMNHQGELRLSVSLANKPANCLLAPVPATQYIQVTVSDSGPGIPAEVLPRIFEPFFTTKQAGARPGTGLGLATVYTMAQQDRLGLSVETVQTKGATFKILIPA